MTVQNIILTNHLKTIKYYFFKIPRLLMKEFVIMSLLTS